MMGKEPAEHAARRSGRRPGPSHSRVDILGAARRLFSEKGFEGTSLRAISREAGVDPALVHHFFGGKEEVFNAALADVVKPQEIFDEVLGPDPSGAGERLMRKFLSIWEQEETRGPLLAMLRSAVSHQRSADLLGQFMAGGLLRHIAESVKPEVATTFSPQELEDRDAEVKLRAVLVCSQLIGVALLRYVFRTEPLASADHEQIARAVGPTVERYLFEPISDLLVRGD
jgi:AcrR family transcriptional regulator